MCRCQLCACTAVHLFPAQRCRLVRRTLSLRAASPVAQPGLFCTLLAPTSCYGGWPSGHLWADPTAQRGYSWHCPPLPQSPSAAVHRRLPSAQQQPCASTIKDRYAYHPTSALPPPLRCVSPEYAVRGVRGQGVSEVCSYVVAGELSSKGSTEESCLYTGYVSRGARGAAVVDCAEEEVGQCWESAQRQYTGLRFCVWALTSATKLCRSAINSQTHSPADLLCYLCRVPTHCFVHYIP